MEPIGRSQFARGRLGLAFNLVCCHNFLLGVTVTREPRVTMDAQSKVDQSDLEAHPHLHDLRDANDCFCISGNR